MTVCMRFSFVVSLSLGLISGAYAQSQPPIQSAQDAACRSEAQSRIFSTPNPQGLSLYDLGAQIYRECMAQAQAGKSKPRSR